MSTQALRFTTFTVLALFGAAATSLAEGPRFQIALPHGHPDHHYQQPLPVFGMNTYNTGYGEKIVRVRRGGIACQLGLERGDVIHRLNEQRLTWHGAWRRALRRAMRQGGHIELCVRDVHTGRLVHRHIDIDCHGHIVRPPVGPITPKSVPVAARRLDRRVTHAVAHPVHVTPRIDPRLRLNNRLWGLLRD